MLEFILLYLVVVFIVSRILNWHLDKKIKKLDKEMEELTKEKEQLELDLVQSRKNDTPRDPITGKFTK